MILKSRIASLSLMVLLLLALVASVSAQEPCTGDPECYEEPTPAPPAEESPRAESRSRPLPPWSGYLDGRLNPLPDEYYSLWCKHTFLEIWRGVPEGSLLQFVPIWLLNDLNANGGTTSIPNYDLTPFTVTRWGDTINVTGNYGNFQPVPGSKSFSLSECIERNGGPIGNAPSSNSSGGLRFIHTYVTVCYGRDSEVVRQGRVPPDQICNERGSQSVVSG